MAEAVKLIDWKLVGSAVGVLGSAVWLACLVIRAAGRRK